MHPLVDYTWDHYSCRFVFRNIEQNSRLEFHFEWIYGAYGPLHTGPYYWAAPNRIGPLGAYTIGLRPIVGAHFLFQNWNLK